MPPLKGSPLNLQFIYRFAEQGGAQGTISLGMWIPGATMLVGYWYRCTQTFTSGGAATVAVGISSVATNTLMAATAIASLATSGTVAAGADLNQTPKYVSTDGQITITIAAADLTAGAIIGYVQCFRSDLG